jgi:GntR family transcriptional regulator
VSGAAVLTAHIDPASDRAVYKQIADHLRDSIARGRLHEGEQLPSEAQLMEHYGVARMTVRNALRILLDEGITTAEHGRGVYVRSRPPVRRLASDRFAQRHRKEGKAAFLAESEQVAATPLVDMIEVSEARQTDRGSRPSQARRRCSGRDPQPPVLAQRQAGGDRRVVHPGGPGERYTDR